MKSHSVHCQLLKRNDNEQGVSSEWTMEPSARSATRFHRRSFLVGAAGLSAPYWAGSALAQVLAPPTNLRVDGQLGATPPLATGSTAIVPASSRTVWYPGIYGGVPPDSAGATTFPNGVGPAIQHGSTIGAGASAATIQAALAAAGAVATKTSRRFVKLGAGTFTVSGGLNIPSYVILRGTMSGATRQTILRQSGGGAAISIWGAGSRDNWGTIRNVVGVANQGDSTITLDNASNINVGDIITIDHLRDGSYAGPTNGVGTYSPPNRGNFVWTLSSMWYQRQPYSTGAGTDFLFPDSDDWRFISQHCEVLAKSGNTLTIYDAANRRGSPLHTTFYLTPQVYRCSGSHTDVRRYAGVEDLVIHPSGTNGDRVIAINGAAFCWVKNVEVNGAAQTWAGRHCQLYSQTYRCEVRDSYFHESGNYNQGGNAYGINISGSENLIENNVVMKLNKPIVLECSNGGNVIAYNYVDEAVIGSLSGTWQEAAISTHASFCHHELFEGNWTPNIGPDSTHGNNGWNTIFRNFCRGRNGSNQASGYRRAIFVDGWQMPVNSIGNVLFYPGSGVQNQITASRSASDMGYATSLGYVGVSQSSVYLIGSNSWVVGNGTKKGADYMDNGMSFANFHRHLDYDYFSNSQYRNPANPVVTLPNSLYLSSKPAFFGSLAWPWVDPAGTTDALRVKTLPAKARYDAGIA
jgi:hypothetical protein